MNAVAKDRVAERFETRSTSDSHFSWIRTRLALEATLLSWVRTSVALIGFGFTIVQFFDWLLGMQEVNPAQRLGTPRYFGLALIGSGVLVLVISAWQYRRGVRYLWSDNFQPVAGWASGPMPRVFTQTPALAVTLLMISIGIAAFVAVMLRLV